MADEDVPVVTNVIVEPVVSMVMVVADEKEKISLPCPDEGAEIVKFRSVAVPDERKEIP